MQKKRIKCPYCDSTKVASIMYGYPDFNDKLDKDIKSGKIVLGGCVIMEDAPLYQCNECNKEWGKLGKELSSFS